MLSLATLAARAQDAPATQAFDSLPPEEVGGGPDDITLSLEEAAMKEPGLFPNAPDAWIKREWRKLAQLLDERARIEVSLAYTMVYLHATESLGARDAFAGDFDFSGKWRLLGDPDAWAMGTLFYQAEQRAATTPSPANLGSEIGSLVPLTDGFNEQDFALVQLYWEQRLAEQRVILRLGKINLNNLVSTNRLANDNIYFLNSTFSARPEIAMPSNPLGGTASYRPNDFFYIGAAVSNAYGKKTTSGFSYAGDGEYFFAVETGVTPTFEGLGKGTYRLTYWYKDAVERTDSPHGQGIALSMDQEVGDRLIAFSRIGYSDGDLKPAQALASLGLGVEEPLGRKDDFAGVAAGWNDPNSSLEGSRQQYVMEAFYRLQLTPTMQLTPDVQLIFDPSNNDETDLIAVFGVRLRASL